MAKSPGVISEAEFVALQSALLQIKQEKYEALEKEQRVSKELTKWKQLFADTDQQLKKANDLISKSKDAKAAQILLENENMKRLIDQTKTEAREQQEALKQHVRELSVLNDKLQQQLDAAEAEKKSLKQKQLESILSTTRTADAVSSSPSPSEPVSAATSSSTSNSESSSAVPSTALVFSKEDLISRFSPNVLGTENATEHIATMVLELLAQQTEFTQKKGRAVHAQLAEENDVLRKAIEQANTEKSEAVSSLAKERDRSRAEVQGLSQLLEKERTARKAEEDLRSRASAADESLKKAQADLELIRGDREAVIAKVLAKDLAMDELRDRLSALQIDLQKAKGRADELVKERDSLRTESVEISEKIKLIATKDHQIEELKRSIDELSTRREADVQRLQEHTKQLAAQLQERDAQIDQLTQSGQNLQKEIKSLKAEIASLKAEKDTISVQLANQQTAVATLNTQLEELQKSFSALESTHQSHLATHETLQKTYADCQTQLEATAGSVAEARAARESAEQRSKELEGRVETAKEEANALLKIAEKKSAKLIKELQEQLQRERAAAARPSAHERKKSTDISIVASRDSSENLNSATASSRTTPRSSAPPSRAPSSDVLAQGPSSKHQRQLSASLKAPDGGPTRDMLLKETTELAQRLGDLQTEKMGLEERNKHLTDSLKVLNAQLDKLQGGGAKPAAASSTVTFGAVGVGGVRRVSTGTATPVSSPVSSPSKGPTKESQLEELTLKNKQLHTDLRMLGEEVARLMEENKKLKSASTSAAPPSSSPAPPKPE